MSNKDLGNFKEMLDYDYPHRNMDREDEEHRIEMLFSNGGKFVNLPISAANLAKLIKMLATDNNKKATEKSKLERQSLKMHELCVKKLEFELAKELVAIDIIVEHAIHINLEYRRYLNDGLITIAMFKTNNVDFDEMSDREWRNVIGIAKMMESHEPKTISDLLFLDPGFFLFLDPGFFLNY